MLVNTSILKAMAGMVNIINSEATITPNDDGWEIMVMDPARVAMLRFRLKKSVFGENYEASTPFTIDVTKFASVLKDMGAETDLTILGNEWVSLKSDGTTRRFKQMTLIDAPTAFPADRLPADNFAIFDVGDLKARMGSLCAIAGAIRVSLSDEAMVFTSASENEDMCVCFPMEKCKAIAGNATAGYPSEYIADIFRAIPNGLSLQTVLSTDFPILLKFTCDDYSAEFVVAPQIESE